jgi:hypothetical protein
MSKKTKPTKVMVAIPAFHGEMHAVTNECIYGQTAWRDGVKMAWASNPFAPLHAAREDLLGRALMDKEIDYVWFNDADMMPLPDCLEKLLATKKDVVTGLYRMRSRFHGPDGSRLNLLAIGDLLDTISEGAETGKVKTRRVQMSVIAPNTGIARTGWAAGGCLLISRAAIEKLGKKAFRPVESDGEDIQFAINCEKAGIEMWVNYEARSNHMHEVQLVWDALSAPNLTWHPGIFAKHGATRVYFEDGGMPTEAELYMVKKGMKSHRIAFIIEQMRKEAKRFEERSE